MVLATAWGKGQYWANSYKYLVQDTCGICGPHPKKARLNFTNRPLGDVVYHEKNIKFSIL